MCRYLLIIGFGGLALGQTSHAPRRERQGIATATAADSLFASAHLGASLASFGNPLGWRRLPPEDFISEDAFSKMLCFLAPEKCIAWTDQNPRPNGWPTYMVAVFSDKNRTNLVDLIRVRDGDKAPLLPGSYERSLETIKPGTTIKDMYSRIGVRDCEYYLKEGNTWCVRFVYFGYRNAIFVYEATAATGVIFSAGDRGI